MRNRRRRLYEILVPVKWNSGKAIHVNHHREWDDLVRKMCGGLTILKASKGNWVGPKGQLFVEKMIPVRIFCTKRQIERISDMTAKHYRQVAVMYYLVSADVQIRKYKVSRKSIPTLHTRIVSSAEIAKSGGLYLNPSHYMKDYLF